MEDLKNIIVDIQSFFSNPAFINYIIAIQFPIILGLYLQSVLAYKQGFKEFKFISYAWFANGLYLFFSILFKRFKIDFEVSHIIVTIIDLFSMWLFINAVKDSFDKKPFNLFKENYGNGFWVVFCFITFGIIKVLPSHTNYIEIIHVRYFPVLLIDFICLIFLAQYFKNLAVKYQTSIWIYRFTLFYAFIQFLSLWQINSDAKHLSIYIDNIGFLLGLLAKSSILFSLSTLLVNAGKFIKTEELKQIIDNSVLEKEDLLVNLSNTSVKILDIKDQLLPHFIDREKKILNLVLNEVLHMLRVDLGFFSLFDENEKKLKIIIASSKYESKIDFTYSANLGISGKAALTKQPQLIKNVGESSEFKRFEYFGHDSKIDEKVNSTIAIPIVVNGSVLGVYVIECEKEKYFTELDKGIVNSIITQASIAIQNLRLFQYIETSKVFLDSLKQIDKQIVKDHLDLRTILGSILERSLHIVNCEFGNIDLVVGEKLVCFESTNTKNLNMELDIYDSISGLGVIEKKTKYFEDLDNLSPEHKLLYKSHLGNGYKCELIVPLIVNNEVIGVFNTESKEINKFSKDDIDKIEGYAGQAAIAIFVAKLISDLKHHQEQLKALTDIEMLILESSHNLTITLQAILEKALQLSNKKHGEILLFEESSSNKLIIKKSTNPLDEGSTLTMDSICGLAITKAEIVYLPFIDIDFDTRHFFVDENIYIPNEKEKLNFQISTWGKMKSELVLPLIINQKVIGVFNIESDKYDDFKEDEIRLLMNLTLSASIAISNARQFDEINAKKMELENSVDKEKIEMSTILGKVINHRIGNSIGMIRTTIKDKLLFEKNKYGITEETSLELDVILQCAERVLNARTEISEKINQLLFSKPQEVDFKDVQQRILENGEFKSYEKIKISINGFENLPVIVINLDLFLEGVVFELITNGIKSIKDKGEIIISGFYSDNQITLQFQDNGCGIKESIKKKIFEKGFSKWNNKSGNGTGLFELKTIIEFLQGEISFETKPNKGTKFIINIPVINNYYER